MSSTSRTTELEAINTMLSCISEAPVTDLDVTGLLDVDIAKSVLNEVSRDIQERGWHFNTENDYPLIRDALGKIAIPDSALKVDTTDKFQKYNVVQRGAYLYDKAARTFVFPENIEVDIVWLFTFEDLPEAARRYIMIRASRIFQARQLGSETQYKFSSDEEMAAQASLNRYEGETGDYNFLSDSTSVAYIVNR